MEDSFAGIGLNLGSGKVSWPFPWKNVDLESGDIQSDIRKIDLPDEYATAIAAIHVIEHFHQWEVFELLTEWKRLLKPGGKLILELPCMDKVLLSLYESIREKKRISPTMSWFVFWGDPKYKSAEMTHKWGYTISMMHDALKEAGFVDIEFTEPRYHFPFRDMRAEAIKPC